MSGRQGGKAKPLKQKKKGPKDLDEDDLAHQVTLNLHRVNLLLNNFLEKTPRREEGDAGDGEESGGKRASGQWRNQEVWQEIIHCEFKIIHCKF